MIRKLKADDDGHPTQCPNEACHAPDEICINNINGFECMSCGWWFDTDKNGVVEWCYSEVPNEAY